MRQKWRLMFPSPGTICSRPFDCSSTICWKDYPFSTELPLSKSIGHKYVHLFWGSLLCSMELFVFLDANTTLCWLLELWHWVLWHFQIMFFFKIVLILGSLHFLMDFQIRLSISTQKAYWDFEYVASVDQLGYDDILTFSDPWTWYTFLFLWVFFSVSQQCSVIFMEEVLHVFCQIYP